MPTINVLSKIPKDIKENQFCSFRNLCKFHGHVYVMSSTAADDNVDHGCPAHWWTCNNYCRNVLKCRCGGYCSNWPKRHRGRSCVCLGCKVPKDGKTFYLFIFSLIVPLPSVQSQLSAHFPF